MSHLSQYRWWEISQGNYNYGRILIRIFLSRRPAQSTVVRALHHDHPRLDSGQWSARMIYLADNVSVSVPTHICFSSSLQSEHCWTVVRPHCIMWRITRAPRLGWRCFAQGSRHQSSPSEKSNAQHNTGFLFLTPDFPNLDFCWQTCG